YRRSFRVPFARPFLENHYPLTIHVRTLLITVAELLHWLDAPRNLLRKNSGTNRVYGFHPSSKFLHLFFRTHIWYPPISVHALAPSLPHDGTMLVYKLPIGRSRLHGQYLWR